MSFPIIYKYGLQKELGVISEYLGLNNELNKQLGDLDFWDENTPLSLKAKAWLEILSKYFDILHNFYDRKEAFRESAQKWNNEKKDMNPWMSMILRNII